jgi:hypothetical protein
MISYLDVLPLLVAACPSYPDSTQATVANTDDGEYLGVGHLVEHLIELADREETDSFSRVFEVVEWVLDWGDGEARALLAEGFFYDLTNPDLYTATGKEPRDFVPWLGPRAREQPAIQLLL